MKRAIFIASLLIAVYLNAKSQDDPKPATKEEVSEVKGAVDGLNETVLEMKSVLDALKKIKISGYIQAQYQLAESAGVANYSGGDLPLNVKSRFQVRRGRFKINYDNDLTQYVLQLDVTQNGVGIKDAYASVKEPWLRAATMTAGVFDRPFGFEISYSSSNRETPERSRVFQTLFPGERELGAKIELAPENGPLSYFNLKGGIFNGVLGTSNENDRKKDFIGRFGWQLPFEEEGIALDGGFSTYAGAVTANSKKVFEIDNSAAVKRFKVDSAAANLGKSFDRNYYGLDLQLYYDVPVIGGASLRGEYLWGKQAGTDKKTSFYNPDAATPTDTKSALDGRKVTDLYIRNFNGWYINYIQNVGLNNQFVLKYDAYTPNSDINSGDIGAVGANLGVADLRYSTLGLGWVHHWDANVKFVLYYEMVNNDKVNQAATGSIAALKEDINDDILTVRMQYKF